MHLIKFSRVRRHINDWLLVLMGLLLIVFGTYGTFQNNENNSGTIYLIYAFPAYVIFFGFKLQKILIKKGSLNLRIFNVIEFQLVLLICGLMLISTMQIPGFLHTAIVTTVATILTGIVIYNLPSSGSDIKRYFNVFNLTIYVTALAALIGGGISYFFESFSIGPIVFYYEKAFWRMNSWYVTSTGLGLFFVLGIYSVLYFYNKTKTPFFIILHIAVIVGLVFGIGLSGARTALVSLFLSLTLIYVMRIKLTSLYIIRLSIFIVFLISVLSYIFITYSEEIYILRRFTDLEDTSSLGGRSDFLQTALNDFSNFTFLQFILGVGIGGAQTVLHWPVSTHSGLLRILLEYGPFAIIFYFLLFLITMLSIRKCIRNSNSFKNEYTILGYYLSTFYFAEFMVIQLFGISMEYCIYLIGLSFFITFRNLNKI